MALSRDIVIRLLGDADSAIKAQRAAADAAEVSVGAYRRAEREFERQQKAMEAASQKQRRAMQDVGAAAVGFGATMAAGLGLAVKAAMDWESSWAGVSKTVNGTERELAQLEEGLRGLARVMPATHQEIAAVAEAAGQLGVETSSIVDFTRTMVNLGETTNLTADEAATSIAQLMNVMQTAPEDVDRLGATLVALGNDGASTEKQIIEMAQRISGAGAIVGLAEGEVLALANTVASMGIEVESGGTSVSRVLTDMSKAAQTGSDDLGTFARTAGVSAEEFARAFSEDPAEAFAMFIEGLAGIQEEGGNVFQVLDDLSLSDVRVSQALLGMASSGDLLRDSLELQGQAWEQNTALVEEAAKRYDTTASQMEIARNNITEAGIEIGEVLLPVLADLAQGAADLAQWFADLPDPIQNVLGGLGSLVGVVSLVGGGFLLLAPRVLETYKALQNLAPAGSTAAAAVGKLGAATKVAAGMVALGLAVRAADDAMAPASLSMEQATRVLLDMGGSIDALDTRFDRLDENLHGWTEIDNFGDAVRRIADPTNTERLNDFGGALFNVVSLGMSGTGEGAASRRRSLEAIKELDGALALMVQNGNAELAAQQFTVMRQEAARQGVTLDELKELYPEYQDALAAIENEQREAAASARMQAAETALLASNAELAFGSLENYAAALGLSEDATAELIAKSNELGESLGEFVDPLGAYTGLLEQKKEADRQAAEATAAATESSADSWEDYVTSVGVSFEEYRAELEQQLLDQQNWQTNMLLLAGRVSQGTLDELSRMGPEGAALVAELVTRSDEELAWLDDAFAARSTEATNAWGAQLTLAGPVLAQIGRTAGQGVVNELVAQLMAGTTTVALIAQQYGIELANGINPILSSLGAAPIRLQRSGGRLGLNPQGGFQLADGGVVSYYANGGMESHVAQIAPAGAWRVWAEPETGGEAYIPLSPSKRGRSVDIWREVGNRLGVEFQEFRFGGINDVPRPPSTAPYQPPISTAGDAAMQKVYGETVDWLKKNLAPALGPGIGYQAMMAALHGQFPGLPLTSGFRPGSITATGNLSYHASGRAVDVPPRSDVFEWIYQNYFAQTRELIFSPKNGRQIWNGRHHLYGEPTRGDHWDHVHWAMANGGIIGEPVVGMGLRTGASYSFGERGPETVTPGLPVGARMSAPAQVHVTVSGAQVTGTLVVDRDGIAQLVDGQIVDAFVQVAERGQFNP